MLHKKELLMFRSDRRGFIKKSSLMSLSLPYALYNLKWNNAAFASDGMVDVKHQKSQNGLTILNDRPLNAETPMHLLDDEITPSERLFVRNNGQIPQIAFGEGIKRWTLTIDGEVENPLSLSLHDLQKNFEKVTYHLILECGGNGRKGYYPQTSGTQWTYGAVGCPMWGGVRLKDVLTRAGVKSSAVYIGYYGYDIHLSGDQTKPVISRGMPIAKALDEMTLLAYEMNGKPLPAVHGFPLRLVCPGYPGSASGKWLKRLWVRDKIHDGPKMESPSYHMPKYPIAPGQDLAEEDFVIIEQMPVKSLITFPKSKTEMTSKVAKNFSCRGFAWTSAEKIDKVEVSFDFGRNWIKADLRAARNRYAWQRWEAQFSFPGKGYYEIWAKATDSKNDVQPMVVAGWNPHGYLNNAMPRIAVNVV